MKTLIQLTLLSMVMLLASCSLGPTGYLADGSFITTGGSVMTAADADARQASIAGKMSLSWVRTKPDETGVAKAAASAWGLASAANSAFKSVQTGANATVATNASNNAAATSQALNAGNAATAQKAIGTVANGAGTAITAPGVKIGP